MVSAAPPAGGAAEHFAQTTRDLGSWHAAPQRWGRLSTFDRQKNTKTSRHHADMQGISASKWAVIGTFIGIWFFSQLHAAAETATSKVPKMTPLELVKATGK